MPSVTRVTLRGEVNTRGEYNAPRYPDATLNSWISMAWRRLHAMLCDIDPDYGVTTGLVMVTSGTASYSLPSDLITLTGIRVVDAMSPSGYRQLARTTHADADAGGICGGVTDIRQLQYAVDGQGVTFYPTPSSDFTAYLRYQQEADAITTDAAFTVPPFGDEWIINDVCSKCATLGNEEGKAWETGKEEAWQMVSDTIKRRDRSAPLYISDLPRPWESYYR